MNNTYFILNGPNAGGELPYDNRPFIMQTLPRGRVLQYVPAPEHLCYRLGPCVLLAGSHISFMPSGNAVIAHPEWCRTLLNPSTGEIRECEFDQPGAGMPHRGLVG